MTSTWTRRLTAAAVIIGAVCLLYFGPTVLGGADLHQLEPGERLAAINGIRGQIGTVISAAFIGGGLYYTGRRFSLDRDKQFTDRYNTAIEHLGSADETTRAGGVRALDRMLHDSPSDRNHILASLTGFLRNHTPADDEVTNRDDVTAVLVALRNRPRNKTGDNPLDLRGTRLPRTNLSGIALSGANLTDTELAGADLTGTELSTARLNRATLTGTDLTSATLTDTDLREARLIDADLTSADLTGADLTNAHLTGTTLTGTTLTATTLTNTDLRGADLRGTTGLTTEQVKRAKVDQHTQLPPTIGHPLDGPTI